MPDATTDRGPVDAAPASVSGDQRTGHAAADDPSAGNGQPVAVDATQPFDALADNTGEHPPTGGAPAAVPAAIEVADLVVAEQAAAEEVAGRAGPTVDPNPTGLLPRVVEPSEWWVDLVDRCLPPRYRLPVLVTTAVSLVLTVGFLFMPLAGTDLSAQVARGHFFETYGLDTVDFRWYGGVYPFGYSVFTGPLNAAIGARGVGAVSCVLAAIAFAWLLARYRVRRPTLGGVLAAMVGVFNLVSGRTTFAVGVAIALFALVAVALPGVRRRWRAIAGGVLALLSVGGSPIAGLFVGLAGGALILAGLLPPAGGHGPRWRGALWPTVRGMLGGYWLEGFALSLGALIGVSLPALMFSDGGVQPFTSDSMKVFVAVGVASFFLLPKRYRALRVGALLTVLLILSAFYLPSPIGSNVTRLPMLYSAPLVAAVTMVDRRLLVGAIVALVWWQPPLVTGDLGNAGDRAAQRAFYQPLIDELGKRKPIGRIEVVPLYDHWESTYVAEAVPLARGWERQVDVDRNGLFYSALTPQSYLSWLYENAVSYVALPTSTRLDRFAVEEQALIEAGLSYLRPTWQNPDWTLYQVIGAIPLVANPGVLVDSGPTGVTFDMPRRGQLTVRVRWSRWLTLSGPTLSGKDDESACFHRDAGRWTHVVIREPGRYTISSGWHLRQLHHC